MHNFTNKLQSEKTMSHNFKSKSDRLCC